MDLVSSGSYCQFTVATLFMEAKSLSFLSPSDSRHEPDKPNFFGSRSSTCVCESEEDEREKQISYIVLAQFLQARVRRSRIRLNLYQRGP
jgi:hypothetical protein